jgi:hypothetical protein
VGFCVPSLLSVGSFPLEAHSIATSYPEAALDASAIEPLPAVIEAFPQALSTRRAR